MSIRGIQRLMTGMTLVELMIALPIVCLLALVAGELAIFGARSFQATSNYLDMEVNSRFALDTLSRDIRQTKGLLSFAPQQLVFLDSDDTRLEFIYSPSTKTLTKIKGNQQTFLLKECNFLEFSIFQRTPIAGKYQFFPTTSAATCKMVQICWLCSRPVSGSSINSECIQNATVVIRKKKTV